MHSFKMGQVARLKPVTIMSNDLSQDGWVHIDTASGDNLEVWVDDLEPIAALSTQPSVADEALPDDIRAQGWSVAVHNDYRLNGEAHTFWLFTKDGRAIKGEGRTDREALNLVRAALNLAKDCKDE